ncbi:olfactory receptor 6M1-like [Lithobates pipiens]
MNGNQTTVTEFILEGLPNIRTLEISLFLTILFLYTVTLLGNFFVLLLICTNNNLRTPMYFFLANYAFLEVTLACVVSPKVMSNLLSRKKSISYAGCLAQSYWFFLLATADMILIAVMSYDRYLAVCNPLRYMNIMTWNKCIILVALSWFCGFLSVNIAEVFKGDLPYCGPNKINHFFCDSVPLMELVCMDTYFIQIIDFLLFSVVILGSLIFIAFTYTYILTTVFRIPSADGRQKAFSTCTSHFTIMIIVYSSSIFLYVTPRKGGSLEFNKLISAIDIILVPAINPFIFTLRNKQVQQAMSKSLKDCQRYRLSVVDYDS